VNGETNPDERFDRVESTLEQLSNSFRHLLTAQVLMNDWQQRTQKLIEQLAQQAIETNRRLDTLVEKVDTLADGQKHNDSNIEALTEMVRQLIERNGNGAGTH
jgi:DNA repair exonuclease SbcCD ATPase subunit